MNLTLVSRHGRSIFNVAGVVNGDPALDRGLDASALPACAALAKQIAAIRIDLCVVSRFPRAQQTAELALGDRVVPRAVDPDFDDIRIGELEGKPLSAYRDWKHGRSRNDP